MKKAVAVLLVLIMCFSLFACSGADENTTSNPSTEKETKAVSTSEVNTADSSNSMPDKTISGSQEEVTVKEPKPMPKGKKVKKPTDKYGMPVGADHLENLRKIFASGKYTIDMNMNVKFEGYRLYVPAIIYCDGKKVAVDCEIGISSFLKRMDKSASSVASAFFSLAGIKNLKVKFISTGKKNYLVITSLQKYEEISEEEAINFADVSISDAKYIGTSNIKVGGINYVCEEFEAKDGEIRRYYFTEGELKRIEFDAAGTTTIIEVNSIKGTVNSSVFTIPSNYTLGL